MWSIPHTGYVILTLFHLLTSQARSPLGTLLVLNFHFLGCILASRWIQTLDIPIISTGASINTTIRKLETFEDNGFQCLYTYQKNFVDGLSSMRPHPNDLGRRRPMAGPNVHLRLPFRPSFLGKEVQRSQPPVDQLDTHCPMLAQRVLHRRRRTQEARAHFSLSLSSSRTSVDGCLPSTYSTLRTEYWTYGMR